METENINKLYLNKYYVYQHSINGKVFYVGKGTGIRAVDFKHRTKKWNVFVGGELNLVNVEIVKTFDCEKEALTYEKTLIESLSSSGVNLANTTHSYKPGHNKKDNSKKTERYKNLNKLQFDNLTEGEIDLFFNIIFNALETDSLEVVIKNYDIKNLTKDLPGKDLDYIQVLMDVAGKINDLRYTYQPPRYGGKNIFSSVGFDYSNGFSDIIVEASMSENFRESLNELYEYFIE